MTTPFLPLPSPRCVGVAVLLAAGLTGNAWAAGAETLRERVTKQHSIPSPFTDDLPVAEVKVCAEPFRHFYHVELGPDQTHGATSIDVPNRPVRIRSIVMQAIYGTMRSAVVRSIRNGRGSAPTQLAIEATRTNSGAYARLPRDARYPIYADAGEDTLRINVHIDPDPGAVSYGALYEVKGCHVDAVPTHPYDLRGPETIPRLPPKVLVPGDAVMKPAPAGAVQPVKPSGG